MAWFRRRSPRPSVNEEQLVQVHATLQDLREGLHAARLEITDIRGLLMQAHQTIQETSPTLMDGIRDVKSRVLASSVLIETSNEAVQRIAEQLYGRNILVAPAPKTDPYQPAIGNVMIPLDPNFQCELRVTSPLHPDIYTARLLLPRQYAKVNDDLPEIWPGGRSSEGALGSRPPVKRIALHIDSRKAPQNLIRAMLSLHKNYHGTLWLVQRDQVEDSDSLTQGSPVPMISYEWQCVETMHRPGDSETIAKWPHDYIFYFNQAPRDHATTYYTVEGMPQAHYDTEPADDGTRPLDTR